MIGFGDDLRRRGDRVRARHPGLLQAAAAVREGALRRRDHRRPARAPPGGHHPRGRRSSSSTRSSCIPGIRPRIRRSCRSCATSGTRSMASQIVEVFRDTLIPAFFADLRPVRPGRHRGLLPGCRLSVLDRAVLAGPTARRRPARCSARGSSATTTTGRAGRADRRGRGVHRAGRPRVARPLRRDRPQPGHVRARRASPTCTLSTGCTTASTWSPEPTGAAVGGAHPRRRAARRASSAMRADRLAVDGADGAALTRRADAAARGAPGAPARRTASPAGPGLVAAAFGIDTAWTGIDLCDPASPAAAGARRAGPIDRADVAAGAADRRRVRRRAWADRPWRFVVAGQPVGVRPVRGR